MKLSPKFFATLCK